MTQEFSYWEHDTFHEIWDVCIIGAGLTGLATGISILQKNKALRVLIVDRSFLPIGASTRNAGFACFGSPTEILSDILNYGVDAAAALVGKRFQGLEILRHRVSDGAMDYV